MIFFDLNAEITLPKALKEELIDLASSSLIPLEVVFLTLSEPARSMNVSYEKNV